MFPMQILKGSDSSGSKEKTENWKLWMVKVRAKHLRRVFYFRFFCVTAITVGNSLWWNPFCIANKRENQQIENKEV